MKVLLDDAPYSPYSEVKRIIMDELGAPPEELFCSFEEQPIASASIAQVHRAILSDGTPIAVKIQKPEIPLQIEWDLRVHTLLMKFFEWSFDLPISWAGAFVQDHLRQEIDFVREANNARICAKAIADEPRLANNVHVPCVFDKYSSKKVLTCEWMDGKRLTDIDELKAIGYNMTEIMRVMVDLFAHQIFVTGFVHCRLNLAIYRCHVIHYN
jgi:aarF domain-containing kinase